MSLNNAHTNLDALEPVVDIVCFFSMGGCMRYLLRVSVLTTVCCDWQASSLEKQTGVLAYEAKQ